MDSRIIFSNNDKNSSNITLPDDFGSLQCVQCKQNIFLCLFQNLSMKCGCKHSNGKWIICNCNLQQRSNGCKRSNGARCIYLNFMELVADYLKQNVSSQSLTEIAENKIDLVDNYCSYYCALNF